MAKQIKFKLMRPSGETFTLDTLQKRLERRVNAQAEHWETQEDFNKWAEETITQSLESILRHRLVTLQEV